MHAEDAYLFRHALLRDAAYDLHLPTSRSQLHELAFYLIEEAFGGKPPEPMPLDSEGPVATVRHPADAVADELVRHIRVAIGSADADRPVLHKRLALYLRRAAEHAERNYLHAAAAKHWTEYAHASTGAVHGEALRRAASVLMDDDRDQEADLLLQQALLSHQQTGST